jgi:hypothetical protein
MKYMMDWILFATSVLISICIDALREKYCIILSNTKVDKNDLRNAIKQHCKLIESVKNFNKFFSLCLLVSFVQTLTAISLLGFHIAIAQSPAAMILNGFRALIMLLQSLMPFYYGQMIINSSCCLTDEIYDSNWHLIEDQRVIKLIILMLQMSQKSLNLRGKGFKIMSFEVYTGVS